MEAPSPRLAVAAVEELIAGGVRDVVVAPGSRSAPLALAIADAERRGLLRLHVRFDERSAAYLALGLAKVSGSPTAVVTTSGTAAVNLHPAVVEAAYAGVPLIAITADRPSSLRGSGANQTIDQRMIFGPDPVLVVDLEGCDADETGRLVRQAVQASMGDQPGPVHLNAPFTEPLVSAEEHAVAATITPTPFRAGGSRISRTRPDLAALLPQDAVEVPLARGILIAGDFADEGAREAAADLATTMGWPVISEPSGNLSSHGNALRHGPMLLASMTERGVVPDIVVTVGRVGLHRPVTRLLAAARVHIAVDVPPYLARVDPARTARAIVDAVPVAAGPIDPGWGEQWRAADSAAATVVAGVLTASDATTPFTGATVARLVAKAAHQHDLLVVGPSWPIRHVSLYAGHVRAACIANRGTSGIDGVMSTAWGAAIAQGDRHMDAMTYALVGDLTALYDRNGLLAPSREPLPRLVYVVADNDGGGIFSALEQGAPEFAADFERVFGTPPGADVASLLAAPRIEVTTVASAAELADSLGVRPDGVRIIVARCASRDTEAAVVRDLQVSVDAALR